MSLYKSLKKTLVENSPLSKAENPQAYKALAMTGFILAYPLTINGKDRREDNNIPYHATVRFFDKENDSVDNVHKIAKDFEPHIPNPKEMKITPSVLKDRLGNDVYSLTLSGPDADEMKARHEKLSVLGFEDEYEWKAHISIPKALYDEIKSNSYKTAADANIEFAYPELRRGPHTLYTYGPKEVQKAEILEPLMKPYSSDAQRRWAHTKAGKEALGGEAAVHEWDEATKGKKLPEKVGKAEDMKKGTLKSMLTAGAMAGSLMAANPAHAPAAGHPPEQYSRDKMLNAIKQVESSGGKNTQHKPTSHGTAYGAWAVMPDTIHETIKMNPDLKRQYRKALQLQGDNLNRYMQDNPKLEQAIVNRHLDRLEHHLGRDPAKLGYAWNQGISGTNKALKAKHNIEKHPYVQKIRHAYRGDK